MDYFGRVAELFITVILLFIVPVSYMSARNELLCQTYVETETVYFVDSVRNIGFVDKQMYETFIRKLSVTNVPYEISMSHYKNKVGNLVSEEATEKEAYYSYYQGIYHDDMMSEILEENYYYFNKGDFFSVVVRKKGVTWGDYLEYFLTGRNQNKAEIQVVYGGSIRDESR